MEKQVLNSSVTGISTLHATALHLKNKNKSPALYFPISINLFLSHIYINTAYMVPLLSGIIDHVATVQRLVLISVGSWWYFLPGTRAEGGTG